MRVKKFTDENGNVQKEDAISYCYAFKDSNECKHVCSIPPSDMLRYKHYSISDIEDALINKKSYSGACIKTIITWKVLYKAKMTSIIQALIRHYKILSHKAQNILIHDLLGSRKEAGWIKTIDLLYNSPFIFNLFHLIKKHDYIMVPLREKAFLEQIIIALWESGVG